VLPVPGAGIVGGATGARNGAPGNRGIRGGGIVGLFPRLSMPGAV